MLAVVAIGVFIGAMFTAMITDLRGFRIPNAIPILMALTFPVAAVLGSLGGWDWAVHLLVGVAVFALGAVLFAIGQMGGGDVKLLSAAGIWFGWPEIMVFLAAVAISGGVLTLALVIYRQWSLPNWLKSSPLMSRLHDRKGQIPYGIAIGVGAFAVLDRVVAYDVALEHLSRLS